MECGVNLREMKQTILFGLGGVGKRIYGVFSAMELRKMVETFPGHKARIGEQLPYTPNHLEISGRINKMIKELKLSDINKFEEELVFGGRGLPDGVSRESKLRLLIILASIRPDEFESEESLKTTMKLAKLPKVDVDAVWNMRLLGSSESKRSSTGTSCPKFDTRKKHQRTQKTSWFRPRIEELVEQLCKGELSECEYDF